MARFHHIVFLTLITVIIASCRFGDTYTTDFETPSAADSTMFRVISQRETDLSHGLPSDCYLPDGTRMNDYQDEPLPNGPRKTSSVTGTAIAQSLLDWENANKVVEIVGVYRSFDADLQPITLSGKVMLPKGQKPKRMILVSHYTVGSNAEAPSNAFSLEGVLVKMGYGLVIPDYIGYGVTADRIHPYLVMDLTALNVLDMWYAVKPWLKAVGMEPQEKAIDLMGYSQGGATTMAVQHMIEQINDYLPDSLQTKIHRVFAGGGPYDVKATFERFINTDVAGYPVAVPLVLQGMIKGNGLNIAMTDMIQPQICENIDSWINSKRYTTAQINGFINTKVTHEILTEEAMAQTSDKVAELYKAMTENSIVSYDWTPKAAVYIMHSMDDETVPYTNAVNAKNKWKGANIEYNFGHYGSHVKCCLRFIYSVQTLLEQEEKEKKNYE